MNYHINKTVQYPSPSLLRLFFPVRDDQWDIFSAAIAAFLWNQLLVDQVTVRGFAPNLNVTERTQAHTYDIGL